MTAKSYDHDGRVFPRELSDRENAILRSVVHLYLLNAAPVGSRALAKALKDELGLSAATIRNAMADLEEMELVNHPHASAGRAPTDKGYRYYVDSLMEIEKLTRREREAVLRTLESAPTDALLKDASKLLGLISRCLAVVGLPQIEKLKLLKIELVALSTNRILVVLLFDSNAVQTVTLETKFENDPAQLEDLAAFINERIAGRTVDFIKEHFKDLVSDSEVAGAPLIRFFIDSLDSLFPEKGSAGRIHVSGAPHIIQAPEFQDPEKIRGVIELIENEDVIIHLLDAASPTDGVSVLIGSELGAEELADYSLIAGSYSLGSSIGTVGVIGPKRMQYSKMVSLVDYVSGMISKFGS